MSPAPRRAPLDLDALIRAAAAGDRAALQSLLVHFQPELLASIRRKIGRRSAGALVSPEDVLQETLAAAARSVKDLKPLGYEAFLGWLKVIARSRLLNMLERTRALKRGGGGRPVSQSRSMVDPGTVSAVVEHLAAGTERPSVVVRKRELMARARRALGDIDADHRRLIDLHVGRGLTHQQVAEQTGRTPGAVKMAVHRALEAIRRRLEGPE